MNPEDLNPISLIEAGALTERNGCTIYAIAGAITILHPELSESEITDKIKSLISVPIENTPLLSIMQEKDLPAPLILNKGFVTAVKWINEGEGDPLMAYLNTRFEELGLQINIGVYHRTEANDSDQIIEDVKSGKVLLLPCFVYENSELDGSHHVAIANVGDKIVVIDINSPVATIQENLLKEMLQNPIKRISYGREMLEISINRDPIISLIRK